MSNPTDETSKFSTGDEKSQMTTGAKDRFWHLRIWNGISLSAWAKMLVHNRFAVHPRRIPMAAIVTGISAYNSTMGLLQRALYGRQIARTELVDDPIFVLGHWRSGTTLLHELLVADSRYTFPDTYTCFAPTHFLTSARLNKWWVGYFLPSRRPMDNMAVGWNRPQEDEWAMCNIGMRSPYWKVAFPNRAQWEEYLDLRDISPAERERWKRTFLWFLKCLTVQHAKRIVLKSPQHTCRVRTLLDMFPNARFVHIARSPYEILPSAVKTWMRMYSYHGFQTPREEGLREYVFETFEHMYRVFEEDRQLASPSQLCDVRYEDLVADPVGEIQRVYETLELGDFESARPALDKYARDTADYQPNKHHLDETFREEIAHRLGDYAQRYGYEER